MQREELQDGRPGERIYADGRILFRDDVKTNICKNNYEQSTRVEENCQVTGSKATQLNDAQQILDIINSQISSLNRLQATTKQTYRQARIKSINNSQILPSGHNRFCATSVLQSEFERDYYMRREVCVTSGCSCLSYTENPNQVNEFDTCCHTKNITHTTENDIVSTDSAQIENRFTSVANERQDVYSAKEDHCRYCHRLLIDSNTSERRIEHPGSLYPNETTSSTDITKLASERENSSTNSENYHDLSRVRGYTLVTPETKSIATSPTNYSYLASGPSSQQAEHLSHLDEYNQIPVDNLANFAYEDGSYHCIEESGVLEGLTDNSLSWSNELTLKDSDYPDATYYLSRSRPISQQRGANSASESDLRYTQNRDYPRYHSDEALSETQGRGTNYNGKRPLVVSKLSQIKMRLDNEFPENRYRRSVNLPKFSKKEDALHYERQGDHLNTSGSSQELRTRFCSTINALELTNRSALERNDEGMRAVKDIAKVSIPSLSALQYLPNQLITDNPIDKLRKNFESDHNMETSSSETKQTSSGSRVQCNSSTCKVGSSEDIHRGSCLLQRLCLCNCLAKSCPQDGATGAGIRDETNNKKSSSFNPRASFKLKPAEHSESHAGESASEDLSTRSERIVKPVNKTERPKYEQSARQEKQSPSFLNILKSSPSYKSQNSCKLPQRSFVDGNVAHEKQNCNSLGSLDVLEVESSRSSESDRNSSPLTPIEESSSFLRFRSSSYVSSTDGENDNPARPKSACSSGESVSGRKRSPYRRFLSSMRLIGSPTKQPEERTDSPSNLRKEQSFFRRSINRLSNKKKQKHSSREEYCSTNDYNCVSPTISISSPSQRDSITNSVNSLDEEITLPHPLLHPLTDEQPNKSTLRLGPEIVLNKVGYAGGFDSDQCDQFSAASSSDLTTTRNSGFDTDNHYLLQTIRPKPRCGSAIMADLTSDIISERASSLPASPRGYRRSKQCHGRDSTSTRLSQSPVPLCSPASISTRIEDGLRVCSTEHFEKHIGNIKENQIEVQKRLFKAWINHFCPNLIQYDLCEELKDGVKLIGLIAILTRDKTLLAEYEKLKHDKQSYINRLAVTPSSRLRNLSNVSMAINHLRQNLEMKLINLNPMDIVSGRPNVILALCWNIILNFQLEQNFFRYLKTPESGSDDSCCTSRLSRESLNGESGNSSYYGTRTFGKIVEHYDEYSRAELVYARKRLLKYINRRFDLKLTNLTSSFLDGDVLLVIMKKILVAMKLEESFSETVDWNSMSNDAKLDYCFDLAQAQLNVPRLFSASDLRQQTIADDSSKQLLVYLSMLLSSSITNESSDLIIPTDQKFHQLIGEIDMPNRDYQIEKYLEEIGEEDAFAIDKLARTLEKIKTIDEMLESEKNSGIIDDATRTKHAKMKEQARQVADLICWINKADNLFESTQKSSADVIKSIGDYQAFFSPPNVPQISTPLCPTLERQYRECLSTAKQRILSMEQTLKNWHGYESVQKQLKVWLATAEAKLANALNPSSDSKSCLLDLIEYFELEPNLDDNDEALVTRCRLPNHKATGHHFLPDINESICGSVLSLGSTSSRISLQSSNKAGYHLLFDEFELRCRLLAAMLDADQREALLIGVKELRHRLRYITEQRVPQVVSELRGNIAQNDDQEVIECLDEVDVGGGLVESPPVEHEPEQIFSRVNSEEINTETVDSLLSDEGTVTVSSSSKPSKSRKSRHNRKSNQKRIKNFDKSRNKSSLVDSVKNGTEKDNEPGDLISFGHLFWEKIKRAGCASFPLNIALLVCLAGLCVVPLLQKNACCELASDHIPAYQINLNQKPI